MKLRRSDTIRVVGAGIKIFFAVGLMLLGASLGYRFAENQSLEPRGESRQVGFDAEASNGPVSDAVRNALAVPGSLERVAALANLLAVTPPSAVDQVANAMAAYFIDVHELEHVLFIQWWASFDPQTAYEWTRAAYKVNHPRAVMAAIEAWARQDPEAARVAAQALPKMGQLREGGEMALVAGWDDSGQEGLVEHVMSLPQGVVRQMVLDSIARRRLLRGGFDTTVEWANEFPPNAPGDFRLHLRRRIVAQLVKFDPEAAKRVAREWVLLDGDSTLLRLLAVPLARRDPQDIMAWLKSEQELDYALSDMAIKESYRVWLSRDRPAALAWMRDQPRSRRMDPGLALYAISIANDDPSAGLALMEEIGDEKARRGAFLKILRFWWIEDSASADAWIAENDVSEEIVTRIKNLPPGQERRRQANEAARE